MWAKIAVNTFCKYHFTEPILRDTMTAELTPISTQLDQTITDIAGQLAPSSKRIYMNDAKHFADWMQKQGLTPAGMTRSDMIAYHLHLAESTYAKATK